MQDAKILSLTSSCYMLHLYYIKHLYWAQLLRVAFSKFSICFLPSGKPVPLKTPAEQGYWKQNSQADLGRCFPREPITLHLKRHQLPVTKPRSLDHKQVCEREYSNSYSDYIFVPAQTNL